jgi:hypothetical protein
MPIYVPKEGFASGEIAPAIRGIASSAAYQQGCHTFTNGVVTPLGAARRRPGSRYIANTVADHPAILIPYTDDDGTRYLVQISSYNATSPKKYRYLTVLTGITPNTQSPTTLPDYLDFADGDPRELLVDTTTDPNGTTPASAPGTIPSGSGLTSTNCYFHPYDETEIYDIRWFQHGGKLIILHSAHPPWCLERRVLADGTEEWAWGIYNGEANRQSMPVLKNAPRMTLSISGTTVTASEGYFNENNAGGTGYVWRIGGPDTTPTTHPWGCW